MSFPFLIWTLTFWPISKPASLNHSPDNFRLGTLPSFVLCKLPDLLISRFTFSCLSFFSVVFFISHSLCCSVCLMLRGVSAPPERFSHSGLFFFILFSFSTFSFFLAGRAPTLHVKVQCFNTLKPCPAASVALQQGN
jgi:hypothetical protein